MNKYLMGPVIINNRVCIAGQELPPAPGDNRNITVINNKVYINGYEWKDNQWKRTLKAMWYAYTNF